jgi:hypothetical protein
MPSPAMIAQPNAGGTPPSGKTQAPAVLAPFTRAAHEHVEPFFDQSTQLDGSTHSVGPVSVPAYGFLRSILLLVTFTGGTGGSAVISADGPWNAFQSIQLTDVNGAPIVGPFGGFALMVSNLYGGYVYNQAPVNNSFFVATDANGNLQFAVRIPIEITSRDALGSLPNQNAASTYKITYVVNANNVIFATPPVTLQPVMRVRMFLEAWTQPNPVDLRGAPQATVPPAMGTTQFWSESLPAIASGFQTVPLPRVGNLIRQVIFLVRTAAGVRADNITAGSALQIQWDGRILINEIPEIRKMYMRERFGTGTGATSPDTVVGAYVYDFTHDLIGKGGEELRDLYLPTTQATRLEIVGTFAAATTLEIITNDVAPTAEIAVM